MADLEDRKVILMDEDGAEHEFEVLDILEVDGAEYAILFPMDEGDNEDEVDEAIILKIGIDENGEEILYEIEDDEEWEKVADAYDSLLEDEEEEE
ncbi:MAG: DUF1292 domain-containing protein [Bacillota bacterium]|jgi:uncharacterized protein YrzB (UPF0473 family)|nr:DUF1292 domain-containing protein [Clostridia bacterium]